MSRKSVGRVRRGSSSLDTGVRQKRTRLEGSNVPRVIETLAGHLYYNIFHIPLQRIGKEKIFWLNKAPFYNDALWIMLSTPTISMWINYGYHSAQTVSLLFSDPKEILGNESSAGAFVQSSERNKG